MTDHTLARLTEVLFRLLVELLKLVDRAGRLFQQLPSLLHLLLHLLSGRGIALRSPLTS